MMRREVLGLLCLCENKKQSWTYVVQEVLDLLELFRSQCARIDTFDLTTEGFELRGISGRRERQRDGFDGHGCDRSGFERC